MHPKYVFVAESPHVSEIEPEKEAQRRPLCGAAGRQWWNALSKILEGEPDDDVSLERLLQFCKSHGIVVMNSVQCPLDPKIKTRYPGADPEATLGFAKGSGPASYLRRKNSKEVKQALSSLRARLTDPSVKDVPIYPLGNDANWFVSNALNTEETQRRLREKIPHPSAWWRRNGFYGKLAKEKLRHLLMKSV